MNNAASSGKGKKKTLIVRGLNALGIPTAARLEWLLGWVQTLAVAGLLAWVVLTFVVIRMTVPTGSMEPTIPVGTSFFVDKISFFFKDPHPGDIVVFWKSDQGGMRERLVKRLVAVGGQSVQIKDCADGNRECAVYVDDEKLSGPPFERAYAQGGQMGDQRWIVPEGHFFVLGDNSPISQDSRYWGFVPRQDLIGEPFLRVLPLESLGFMNGYFGSPR